MSGKNEEHQQKGLPPDQRTIPKILRWVIDHPTISGFVPKKDLSTWTLRVDGDIKRSLQLSWTDFLAYPKVEVVSDFHCVEGWSVLNCSWEGWAFKHLVDQVTPVDTARFVSFECADGYSTSLLREDLVGKGALLASKLNGKDLDVEFGGPLRLIISDKYCYKSAMWLTRITFTSQKEMGYWETRGYSDTADVWKNDRFARMRG